MKIINSLQFWYYLCNRILLTFINVEENWEILKEKKICQTFLKNTQQLLILNWSFQERPLSAIYKVFFPELDTRVLFSHITPFKNKTLQLLTADEEGNSIFMYILWKYKCYNDFWIRKLKEQK